MDRLIAILDALRVDADERDRLLGLRHQADGPGRLGAGVDAQLWDLIEYERAARRITDVAPLIIPGLLQTSAYAAAVLGGGPDIQHRVTLRVGRTDVITRWRDPVEYVAYIDSHVLSRPFAEPDVMHDQLAHLLRMAEKPNITVRVVPAVESGWHPMMCGPYILIEFPAASPVVHLEHHRASTTLWDSADVAEFEAATETIASRAMTPDRTADFIAEIMKGMQA